ncbi:MAG: phosphoribosylglycinamide formyltransferase [Fidelibacterota bacterium]|nr:MAG: phosphoribosylglycinamide formyltransferase [Candidatus Neomarinimicrobiota bacterium]
MKQLAIFVSGRGSNFREIHAAAKSGDIPANVALVVTDKIQCPAADYARDEGIEVVHYPAPNVGPPALLRALEQADIDYIVLAGYLKLVPSEVVQAFPQAMLNIHPALLPAFGGKGYYGRRVHEAVIASGAKVSGVSVHFVDEEYDHGPIVAQVVVSVQPDDTPDTLAKRVLKQEHKLYSRVVAALCRGEVHWREDGVPYVEPPIMLQDITK